MSWPSFAPQRASGMMRNSSVLQLRHKPLGVLENQKPVMAIAAIAVGAFAVLGGAGIALFGPKACFLILGLLCAVLLFTLDAKYVLLILILALPFDFHEIVLNLSLADMILVILALKWSLRMRHQRLDSFDILLILIFMSFGLSIVHSVLVRDSSSLSHILTVLASVSLPFLASRVVVDVDDLSRALLFALVAGFIMAVTAIMQTSLFFLMGIRILPDPSNVYYITQGLHLFRATGFYPEPNFLALYLLPSVVVGIVLAGSPEASSPTRYFGGAQALLGSAAIICTLSRGGMLSLAIAVVLTGYLSWRRSRFVLFTALVAGAILMFWSKLARVVGPLLELKPENLRGRLYLMLLTLQTLRQHWLLGRGAGAKLFVPASAIEAKASTFSTVHNSYFQVLAEFGLLGSVAYGILLLLVLYRGMRVVRNTRKTPNWVLNLACVAGLVALMIGANTVGALAFKQFWLLLGLVIASIRLTHKSTHSANDQGVGRGYVSHRAT